MWYVYAEDRCSPAVAFLLNSGFHMPLSLSSHGVPREIRLSFELVCHRHIDEVAIITTCWNFLGKKGLALWHTSCPLKSSTERCLSRPSFQTPAPAWKETSGGLSSWTSTSMSANSVQTKQIFTVLSKVRSLCASVLQLDLLRFFLEDVSISLQKASSVKNLLGQS